MSALPAGMDSHRDVVLDAANEAEFLGLLREILQRSGRTAGQVSAFTGLPRSTAYRFVDPKNRRMPKDRGQVELFAKACGLNTIQLNRLLWLWDRLRGVEVTPHVEPTEDTKAALTTAVAGSSGVLEVVHSRPLRRRVDADARRTGWEQRGDTGHDEVPGVLAGAVHNLVVNGGIQINHYQGRHHHAEGDSDTDTGATRDGTDPQSNTRSRGGWRGWLTAVLQDREMFRHLMVLLVFLAVVVLGLTGLLFSLVLRVELIPFVLVLTAVMGVGAAMTLLLFRRWPR